MNVLSLVNHRIQNEVKRSDKRSEKLCLIYDFSKKKCETAQQFN